ncbi:hypothetical protein [Pedobacter sp. MW01-1-1]|uniref:hypothetical protein n=1 Tax=Pedobacter sp. MW01-1-1 TaxID=3383027 RepID=UPI003FEDA0C0
MKTTTILSLFTLFAIIVKGQEQMNIKDKIDTSMNNAIIEKALKKQLKQGSTFNIDEPGAGLSKMPFQLDELEATVEIANEVLKSNGFNKLSNEDFNQRIKNIFGRIIDNKSHTNVLYINLLEKCNRKLLNYKNNLLDYEGTYIVKDRNFITDFYYIPELIDYQRKYPSLNNLENATITRKSGYDDLDVEIPHWKDNLDLKEIRKLNIQTIVARNMYLFNDNKAQYKWLILHDENFMVNLVQTFGYTQDLDLLKWVIERTEFDENRQRDYGKLFWTKQCNGTLKIHSNTFKVLQQLIKPNDYTSKNTFILNYLKEYLAYLADETTSKNEKLTRVEKLKILANIAYFAEQYKYDKRFLNGLGDQSMMIGRLRSFMSEDDKDILAKNNYFNLPKFKEWWDNADYDLYVVGGEYEGAWGTGFQPLSEKEWREQKAKEN